MKDDLFSKSGSPEKFEFNEPVARVFDDMLIRSIPLYRECQEMVVDWCVRFAREGSSLYDLGCSTGSLLLLLSKSFPAGIDLQLIGVDNSAPMLDKARAKLNDVSIAWDLVQAELDGDFSVSDASVVVMNYTLQFIPIDRRPLLAEKIYQGLLPGGCVVLTEKVVSESAELDGSFVEFHHSFKRDRGYSSLEISRKREALENVLTPVTLEENLNLLRQAGFRSVDVFFKWNNFAGFVALK
jgi:tRNA (cmo5U34)-methyltransferase